MTRPKRTPIPPPDLTDKDGGYVVRTTAEGSSAASWVALAAHSTLTGGRGGGKIGTFATSKEAAEAVRKQFRRYEAPRARARAKAAKLAGRSP